MSETVDQLLSITDAAGNTTISLDGTTGDVTVGGGGQMGNVVVRGSGDSERIRLDSGSSKITCNETDGTPVVEIGGGIAGTARICLDGSDNKIVIRDADSNILAQLGANANLVLGGGDDDGDVTLKDSEGNIRIHAGGGLGIIELKNENEVNRVELSSEGSIAVGGGSRHGELTVLGAVGTQRIRLDASNNNIVLKDEDANIVAQLGEDGNLVLGGGAYDGDIKVKNDQGTITVEISGNTGDILLFNADCAEEFDLSASTLDASPGTVLVLEDDGRLVPCLAAYDRRVAGIAAGAGEYKPGIVLDRRVTGFKRIAVALVGKTYCRVDAGYGPVAVGTPLTTSATPGHAQAAADPLRGFGATIGKALAPLASGCGLIPVLVSLR